MLFTSPVLEHPPAGGSQLRVENAIKALARIAELDLVSRAPLAVTGGQAALDFFSRYASETSLAPSARRLSANRYLRKAQRVLRGLGERDAAADARFIVAHARRRAIGVVWCGYGNISFPLMRRLKAMAPELKLVCDTDSVWSRFILRELPYAGALRRGRIARAGRRKEAEERAWVELCDVTTAVSEVDAAYYRQGASRPERVRVFSNGIDLDSYPAPAPAPGLKKPCIYLAGTFGHAHSPMDVAARWLIDEVLPIVRRRVPGVHLYLVGTGSERMWGHLSDPGITVTGKLPSVLPYLCHADVSVVPLKFESGTRFKILEAGACGVPVVSTTLGAEGLPVRAGVEALLADEPGPFAEAIVRVLQDRALAGRLAASCREMVRGRYSIDALEKEARSILEGLQ
jgi:glycosyltransferase involved in cell wall biosynthesis